MKITESQLRKIVWESLEDVRMTIGARIRLREDINAKYKAEGPRSWMRVSNDFAVMALGDEEGLAMAQMFYPGLKPHDFSVIADKLDTYFGMN